MIRATRSKSIDRVDLILWITRKIAADPCPPHELAMAWWVP